ncbi:hypothetical protein [Bacillus mojavensis]
MKEYIKVGDIVGQDHYFYVVVGRTTDDRFLEAVDISSLSKPHWASLYVGDIRLLVERGTKKWDETLSGYLEARERKHTPMDEELRKIYRSFKLKTPRDLLLDITERKVENSKNEILMKAGLRTDVIRYDKLENVDQCLDALNDLSLLHDHFGDESYLQLREVVRNRLKELI